MSSLFDPFIFLGFIATRDTHPQLVDKSRIQFTRGGTTQVPTDHKTLKKRTVQNETKSLN